MLPHHLLGWAPREEEGKCNHWKGPRRVHGILKGKGLSVIVQVYQEVISQARNHRMWPQTDKNIVRDLRVKMKSG